MAISFGYVFGELDILDILQLWGLLIEGFVSYTFGYWIIGDLDIIGYFPTLGLIGQGHGVFVNRHHILLDMDIQEAGYFRIFSSSGFGWLGSWGFC